MQNQNVYEESDPPIVPAWWPILKFFWRVAVYLFMIIAMIGLIGGSMAVIIHLFGGVKNLP